MPGIPDVRGAIGRWRDEIGDTRAVRAARVVLGLLLLESALRAEQQLQGGYFGDVFHWPLVPEALVVPRGAYAVVVAAEVILAAMVTLGFRARWALLASAILGTYVLLCDRVQFHHNRWALACYSLLLALAPCDRAGPRQGPLWAARLAQVQVALIYVASGGSKLLDPDWRGGRVIIERIALYGGQAVDAGVPQGVLDTLSQPATARALATLAIATELGLSVGLWPRRTRAFALWWGVWFHLTIEATSRVEGFTWLTLAMYALFARPDARARTLLYDASRPRERTVARAIAGLDWLTRFELRPRRGGEVEGGIVVIGRDGTQATGLCAVAAVARCIPLLFPLWLPLAGLAALGAARREPPSRS